MLIYWGIFLILATGAFLNHGEEANRSGPVFVLLAAIPTAAMIGLRWQIGPDWTPYLEQFKYTKLWSPMQALTHVEPGYFMLNWLVHQFGGPFWSLNLICATVFVAGLTVFCRRQPNKWLAFLVAFPYLVIVIAMSGNRQSLAIGFLFFALNALERQRLNQFVLLILIAALFHGSILLILPLCLLSSTHNGLQRILLLTIVLALGFYFFRDVFGVYTRRYSSDHIQSSGVAYRLAMNSMCAVLFLSSHRRFALQKHQTALWRNISICTLALVLLFVVVPSSTAVDRFLLYLFPLQFLVLSRVPKAFTAEEHSRNLLTALVIGYAATVQVTFLTFGTFAVNYLPYRSIFNG